jgi:spore maturation protein CgeB
MIEVAKKYDLWIWAGNYGQWIHNLDLRADRCFPGAYDEDISKIYAQAKIVLGINFRNDMPGVWSDRASKVMLCGAFHLAKYVPLMEREYDDGIAYYKDFDECLEKIGYYLEHEDERIAIAKRGLEIALDRHTIEKRLNQLLTFFKYAETYNFRDARME